MNLLPFLRRSSCTPSVRQETLCRARRKRRSVLRADFRVSTTLCLQQSEMIDNQLCCAVLHVRCLPAQCCVNPEGMHCTGVCF